MTKKPSAENDERRISRFGMIVLSSVALPIVALGAIFIVSSMRDAWIETADVQVPSAVGLPSTSVSVKPHN